MRHYFTLGCIGNEASRELPFHAYVLHLKRVIVFLMGDVFTFYLWHLRSHYVSSFISSHGTIVHRLHSSNERSAIVTLNRFQFEVKVIILDASLDTVVSIGYTYMEEKNKFGRKIEKLLFAFNASVGLSRSATRLVNDFDNHFTRTEHLDAVRWIKWHQPTLKAIFKSTFRLEIISPRQLKVVGSINFFLIF
jgi:hypothetical protein